MASKQIRQAVAYLRTNDGSAEKFAAQRAHIIAWASRTETEIAGWHRDCVSANSEMPQRPELCRAMQELESGMPSVFVVARPQVLSRSVSQMFSFLDRMRGMGAEVQSADGGIFAWHELFFSPL